MFQLYWAYIPHFVHTFLCIRLCVWRLFSELAYSIYQDAETGSRINIWICSERGTLRHQDLPALWSTRAYILPSGLSVIESFVDELETLTN